MTRAFRGKCSFDPKAMLGIWTNWLLQSRLMDLRTGKVRLTLDNSANFQAEIVSRSYPGGRLWFFLFWGVAALVLISLVGVLWRCWRWLT